MPGAKARLRLDGADPINRGLDVFLPFTDGRPSGGVLNISPTRRGFNYSTSVGRRVAPWGNSANFSRALSTQAQATAIIPQTPELSVAMWVMADAAPSGAFYSKIFCMDNGGGRLNFNWDHLDPSYRGAVETTAGGFPKAKFTTAFAADTPYFLVATRTNTLLTIYCNGKQEATAVVSLDAASALSAWGGVAPSTQYWSGRIGIGRIWTRVITPQEVMRLYRDPWAGTARRREPILYRPPISYPFAPEPVGYQYTTGNVALTYAPGTGTDTGARGGDDAPASAADLRRLASLRRRQEAEDTERAARLRQSLERAYRAATGAVEDAGPDTLEAAQNALQAVAAVEPNLPVLDIAPMLGTARALEELTRLIQLVQLRWDRIQREDEELAMMLAVL